MSGALDKQKLDLVFKARPDILQGIEQAADSPARVTLFNNIASHVYEQIGDPASSEPSLKRRRVDPAAAQAAQATQNGAAPSPAAVADEDLLLEIKDISVAAPIRKKVDLCFTAEHLYARAPGTTTPIPNVIYAWEDVESAFCLPVPEKAQVQYNYVLFPRSTCLASLSKDGPAGAVEPLVFTVNAGAPKPDSIGGSNKAAAATVSDTYCGLLDWAVGKCLDKYSARLMARSSDKVVHVKAFRGSKDGYLFFLESGILWGFKKPLMFIPIERIAAVSYTNVLQRTFNIAVEVLTHEAGQVEASTEVEFGMLDQEHYQAIDEKYIRAKGLQDRSLAEQRMGKLQLAENAKNGKTAAEGGAGSADVEAEDDGLTDLQRVEQQLQDEEDEDEEDYDPGSDGDSGGSGESSEEDDDDDDDDGGGGEEMDEDEEGEGEGDD